MIAWFRTADGWALNLDGSAAVVVFSLPRLEVRSSARGWRSLCLLRDGSVWEHAAGRAATAQAAKVAAAEQARLMLGPADVAALDAWLLSRSRPQ